MLPSLPCSRPSPAPDACHRCQTFDYTSRNEAFRASDRDRALSECLLYATEKWTKIKRTLKSYSHIKYLQICWYFFQFLSTHLSFFLFNRSRVIGSKFDNNIPSWSPSYFVYISHQPKTRELFLLDRCPNFGGKAIRAADASADGDDEADHLANLMEHEGLAPHADHAELHPVYDERRTATDVHYETFGWHVRRKFSWDKYDEECGGWGTGRRKKR